MKARTQMQRCTMKLSSRQNTFIYFTSGERLHQLKLIVYSWKTRKLSHFLHQLLIIHTTCCMNCWRWNRKPQIKCNTNNNQGIQIKISNLERKKHIRYTHQQKNRNQKCQHYTQVVKRFIMSILCTSGWKIKNVNIIHKWLKGWTILHCTQVVKRLKMSPLYTSG